MITQQWTTRGSLKDTLGGITTHHRSVSQLTSYAGCGEAYRLERVAKVPQTPAAWFAQGTAVHEAVERWERTYREHSPEQAQAWYYDAWEREIEAALAVEPDLSKWQAPGRTKPDTDLKNRMVRGADQVAGYIAYALQDRLAPIEYEPGEPSTEVPFTLDLDGVRVIGSIDLILADRHGRLLVRDIKTGSRLPTSPIQLAVYAVAVEDLLGDRPFWGDYFMCKNNAPTDPIPLRNFTREDVARWFVQMDRSEKAGNYLPNPGDRCKTCGVRRYCSVMGSDRTFFSP
ncbi:PD-(D/E)XK nuclease family protein [Nonomuraea roseoviolacea]|uniref:PD-(D/E)XK nuclease family protein n=1 Tax=Nonomuraea roseoviolacea TaxID=103837 RepID=UPI0031DEEE6E